MQRNIWFSLVIGVAAGVACGGEKSKIVDDDSVLTDGGVTSGADGGDTGDAGDGDTSGDGGEVVDLEPRCAEAPAGTWSAGTPAFAAASEAWGLPAINATGTRISSVDFDGDGYPDLIVRKASYHVDDFSPDGSRATWLLRNTGEGGFEDVTQSSGILGGRFTDPDTGRPAEVFAFADVDGDGDLDAFTGFSSDGTNAEGNEIMLNAGDATFELGPVGAAYRLAGQKFHVSGASFVDVDRDGLLDLWTTHYTVDGSSQQDRLWRQTADGWEDATAALGLTTSPWTSLEAINEARGHAPSWSAAACDLDGDGNPELLSAAYGRAPNHLWLGGVSGYTNASISSGYAFDHRQDWTTNENARCYCQLNPQGAGCDEVTAAPGIACDASTPLRWNHPNDREPFRLGGNSGTTVCADLNNDGALDLLTTEIVHWDVGSSSDPSEILYNSGEDALRFERPGNEVTGLTRVHELPDWNDGDITAAVFDWDNDMRQDVYIGSTAYPGTRGLLYHQQPDGSFVAVPLDQGIDHSSSHGLAVADYDRDGDLDLALGHSRFRCQSGDHCYPDPYVRLFENRVGQQNNWVQLDLEGGPVTNRAAIGARITVEAGGVTQTHEIGGGHGHYGIQHDLVAHFGLAEHCEARVTVRWPDAQLSEQSFTVPAGYRFRVVQGEAPVLSE